MKIYPQNMLLSAPPEIIAQILSYLRMADLGRLERVCKKLQKISIDDLLWAKMTQHFKVAEIIKSDKRPAKLVLRELYEQGKICFFCKNWIHLRSSNVVFEEKFLCYDCNSFISDIIWRWERFQNEKLHMEKVLENTRKIHDESVYNAKRKKCKLRQKYDVEFKKLVNDMQEDLQFVEYSLQAKYSSRRTSLSIIARLEIKNFLFARRNIHFKEYRKDECWWKSIKV